MSEKQEFQATCDRAFRSAAIGKLSLQDMEFAVQNIASKDQRTGRLSIRDDVNEERLREFQRRMTAISDKQAIPSEPFEKSVSQVFQQMMDDALKEDK